MESRLWAGRRGSIPDRGIDVFFIFATASRPALGTIQWVAGVNSQWVNWPGSETDHSSPSSTEIKNAWSYTSVPAIRRHGVMLN